LSYFILRQIYSFWAEGLRETRTSLSIWQFWQP